MLKKLLQHPLAQANDIDAPETTAIRKQIIYEKPFLYKLYTEWYSRIITKVPSTSQVQGQVLELGSSGGFFKEVLPECITSEVFPVPGVDRVLFAENLPFEDSALRAIVMVDVLHHIPDVSAFFAEAARTLAPKGKIIVIEPWNTPWGKFIYQNIHHEPFLPEHEGWDIPILQGKNGPLSRANGALPWILFSRDRAQFEEKYPSLKIECIQLDYPFSYLASGGVAMRSLAPGCLYSPFRAFEKLLSPCMKHLAMFAFICIEKQEQ